MWLGRTSAAPSITRPLNSSLFPYMIVVGIASNVVTTVTMVTGPPTIILAIETGMKFKDSYWFLGRPGLGTLTVVAVVAALLTLLLQFHFDWNSFAFIMGVFVVTHSLRSTGLLTEFAGLLHRAGLTTPALAMGVPVWISVPSPAPPAGRWLVPTDAETETPGMYR